MKIKHLSIKSHKVLKDKEYPFQPGFNLIFGFNEQGKSLTLDTLVKLLFGKDSKKFENINRVKEDPAQFGSFVSLQTNQNGQKEVLKLQGKPNLTDLVGLSADECQNLFLIRNSNLSIGQDLADQDKFYTNLTDRLTGLKTQEIQSVKKELRNWAELTEKTDDFQSTDKNLKLKDRLNQAQDLIATDGKITQLIQQDKKQKWSDQETLAVELRQKLISVAQKLGQLETAKQKQQYQLLLEKITQYQQLTSRLESLKKISQQQLNEYQLAQQDLENLKEAETELKQELETKKQKLEQEEQQYSDISQKINQQNKINEEFKNQVGPELVQLTKQSADLKAVQIKPWKIGSFISSLLLMVSLAVYILQPTAIILSFIAIFFITTVLSSLKYFVYIQKQQKLDTQLEEIKLNLAKYGIREKELDNILEKTYQYNQQFEQLKNQQATLQAMQKQTKADISEKESKRNTLQSRKEQTLKKITEIKGGCQVKNLAELEEKLNKKRVLENQQQKLEALITDQLDTAPNEQNNLASWKTKIQRMKYLEKIEIDLTYSQELVEELTQQKQDLEFNLEQLKQQLSSLKNQLHDLEKEINQVLKDRTEPLVCENMNDLIQAQQEIQDFIEFHYHQRQQAIDTIKILNTIEKQEKEKVGELFGPKSIISQYFKEITNNRYDTVTFDQPTGNIMVNLRSEEIFLPAESLSSGAYDQLYFAIRLGLGQKLLDNQAGFFILDDPFIKSDQKRLRQQLDMLLNFSKNGWQIIYFSAKNEVRDYLENKVNNLITIKN
jgi:DNA repair exonuclease SbcCD ATPase subunit